MMTPEILAALEILRVEEKRSGGWFSGIKGRRLSPDVDKACKMLAAGKPEELLVPLSDFVRCSHLKLREKVAAIYLDLALGLPASTWPIIDQALRKPWYTTRLDSSVLTHPASIIAGACDWSGRVRQKAINLFGELPPVLATSLALVRMNDWVEVIRRRAAEVFVATVAALNGAEKLAMLPLLTRLRKCGRHNWGDDPQLFDLWMALLINPFDETAWLESWRNRSPSDSRMYLEALPSIGDHPGPVVRRELLKSGDRFALNWYIRNLLATVVESERAEANAVFPKCRIAQIRRDWLLWLMESAPEEAVSRMKAMLLDRSAGMRQFARFHLGKMAPMDFVSHCRAALSNPDMVASALLAMADVAPDEAHEEAVSRMDSKESFVRKAAILAIKEDSLEPWLGRLLAESESPDAGVPKLARKRLKQVSAPLERYLMDHPVSFGKFSNATRRFLISQTLSFGEWTALELLLRWSLSPELGVNVERALKLWIQKSEYKATRLPETAADALIAHLAEAKVDPELEDQLGNLIRRRSGK